MPRDDSWDLDTVSTEIQVGDIIVYWKWAGSDNWTRWEGTEVTELHNEAHSPHVKSANGYCFYTGKNAGCRPHNVRIRRTEKVDPKLGLEDTEGEFDDAG